MQSLIEENSNENAVVSDLGIFTKNLAQLLLVSMHACCSILCRRAYIQYMHTIDVSLAT